MSHPSNPEWTLNDFAAAKRPEDLLPTEVVALFPKTKGRGPQKAPTKTQVTLRLDPDVLERYKAMGRGWQRRVNDVLREGLHRNAR